MKDLSFDFAGMQDEMNNSITAKNKKIAGFLCPAIFCKYNKRKVYRIAGQKSITEEAAPWGGGRGHVCPL